MRTWFAAFAACVSLALGGSQDAAMKITWPTPDTIVSGPTPIEVSVDPGVAVTSVRFSVNGRVVCTVERRPFRCAWDPGPTLKAYHVRVVASLEDGRPLVANVWTKNVGYTERTRVDAVLVPVIVTDRGQFVKGLTRGDFEILEDGVPQRIASLVAEESPLDLVMAVDISGSMEGSIDAVKDAVKQFLAKLRPGDATTLVGFNENVFVAAERETDPEVRTAAVDLLAAWGGTAMYDATVRVLDMVSRETSRKGVVIFSDGADQDSMTSRDTAMARVQSSDAMLYTIGFGSGLTVPALRQNLTDYAVSTGGRAFFPGDARELDRVFSGIINELANQYVLSYSSSNAKLDNTWRDITVRVRKGRFDVRARRGYLAGTGPRRGGSHD